MNWTYTGTTPLTPFMTWSGVPSGGPAAVSHGTYSASVNLNDLAADTTYTFTVEVDNNCGSAQSNGQFTTAAAPTNEFVGWVFGQLPNYNSYLLNQAGPPTGGIQLLVTATCPYDPDTQLHNSPNLFQATTSSASGAYTIAFPLYTYGSYGDGDTFDQELSSNGNCNTYTTDGGYGPYYNAKIGLGTASSSYFAVSHWVSTSMSASNDYVEFIEPANVAAPVPVGTAYIHGTDYAECSFTYWTTTTTSTITQDIGINSCSGTKFTSASGQSWNSPGGFGTNNALNLIYPFSGFVNETTSSPTIGNLYVTGEEQGPSANPVAASDGVALITTPPYQELGSGWHEAFPNSGQTKSNPLTESVYGEGSFASTSGISDSLSVTVGWSGVSVGTTVSILATTTVTTTIQTTASCGFAYPGAGANGGEPYFYYHDTEPTDQSIAAPVVDVWFVGFCGGSGGEPKCSA
ncbi:MAG: hypothetical protein WA691_00040 [Thermoplasmata archaeon]